MSQKESEKEENLEISDEDAFAEDHRETLKQMLENPKPILEALLFASREPLSPARIKEILRGASIKNLPKLIEEMNEEYEQSSRSFRIEKIAKGYMLMTLPDYAPWLKKLHKPKVDTRLSQAALETLAVVSYRQPLTRAEVDAIRGVSSSHLLKALIDKGLLRIAGQADVIGRPLLYGTTQKFLDLFSLGDLKDLPELSDVNPS
jgi:segregation and condensation protein B